jgi:reductive dehalogenase
MAKKRLPEGLEEMGKYDGELEWREIQEGYDELLDEVRDTSMERRTLLKAFAGGGGLATLNALFAQKKFMGDDLESGFKAVAAASDTPFGVRKVDEPPYDVTADYKRIPGYAKAQRIPQDASEHGLYGPPSGFVGEPDRSMSDVNTQIDNAWVGHGSATIGTVGPVKASSRAEARALWALAESDVDPGNYAGEPIETGTFREVQGLVDDPLANRAPDMTDPVLLKDRLFKVGRMYGLGDMGVSDLDPRWWYSHSDAGVPIEFYQDVDELTIDGTGDNAVYRIPEACDTVVSVIFEMPIQWGRTGYSLGSGIASNFGYEQQGYVLTAMSRWIEFMGYHAIPSANHGLAGPVIPQAIDGGLGEQGRHARLIHPQYGSNVRVARILTDMPLERDTWIEFGAQEFCKACKICAQVCPAGAIPMDTEPKRNWEDFWPGTGEFKTRGNKHWYNNAARCRKFWRENGTNDSQCVATCPFSSGRSWLHDLTRAVAGSSHSLDKMMADMSGTFGYEAQYHPEAAWDQDWLVWGRKLDPALGGF